MPSPERGLTSEELEPKVPAAERTGEEINVEVSPETRGLLLKLAEKAVGAETLEEAMAQVGEGLGQLAGDAKGFGRWFIGREGKRFTDWNEKSEFEKRVIVRKGLYALLMAVGGVIATGVFHANPVGAEELSPGQHLRAPSDAGHDTLAHQVAGESGGTVEQGQDVAVLADSLRADIDAVSKEFGIDSNGEIKDDSPERALLVDLAGQYADDLARLSRGEHQGYLPGQEEYVGHYRDRLTLAIDLMGSLRAEHGSKAAGDEEKYELTGDDLKSWQDRLPSLTDQELRMSLENQQLLEKAVDLAQQRVPFMTSAMEIALRGQALNAENRYGGEHLSSEAFKQELDSMIDRLELLHPKLYGQKSENAFNAIKTGPEPKGFLDPERPTLENPDHLEFSEMYSDSKKAEIQAYVNKIDFTLRNLDGTVNDYFSDYPDLDDASKQAVKEEVEKQADGLKKIITAIEKVVANPTSKEHLPLLTLEQILKHFSSSNSFQARFPEGSAGFTVVTQPDSISAKQAEHIVAHVVKNPK